MKTLIRGGAGKVMRVAGGCMAHGEPGRRPADGLGETRRMISNRRMTWLFSLTWWHQSLLILLSYVVLSSATVLFIAPTGPGSGRILFVILLVHSCLMILLNSRTARLLGLVVGIIAIAGVIQTTKARKDFGRAMQEKAQRQRVERSGQARPPRE